MSKEPSTGKSYWVSQFVAFAIFAIGGFASAYFFLVVDTEEPGRGVITGLLGIAGVVGVIWVLRETATSTKAQRAIYAWAITQQHSPEVGSPVNNDFSIMATAKSARDGKLTLQQLQALQALKPSNPYPGPPLPPPRPDVSNPPR
ncbi:MAG: hypothetical protein ACOH19_00220 [Rhodoglobus sp.]